MPSRRDEEEAIRQAAGDYGIDPNFALAVAQRESAFDPNAHASRSIYGMFQMTGGLRNKWGSGDSDDPYTQAASWMRYIRGEVAPAMRNVLGREPTNNELYLGHHFGPGRAARMVSGAYDPSTPVAEIFSPYERSLNPHFDRAGTSGNLVASINNDMDRRHGNFAGGGGYAGGTRTAALDFSQFGEAAEKAGGGPLDFSKFATPVETSASTGSNPVAQDIQSDTAPADVAA